MNIQQLKGIGEKTAALLSRLSVYTVKDLVGLYPRAYDVYEKPVFVQEAVEEHASEIVSIEAVVARNVEQYSTPRMKVLSTVVRDEQGTSLKCTWFNMPFLRSSLKPGAHYVFRGQLAKKKGSFVLEQPQMYTMAAYAQLQGSMQPIYPLTKGLSNKTVAKAVKQALEKYDTCLEKEYIPVNIRSAYQLAEHNFAVQRIHFPQSQELLRQAEYRLKFEELLGIQLAILSRRVTRTTAADGFFFPRVGEFFNGFYRTKLPFELTGAQKRVVKEIRADTVTGHQMNRLLQGDVGSGKTLVALMAMLLAADNGFQACMMVPTEILARQHFVSITKMVEGVGVRVAVLTGSTKKRERDGILEELASGGLHILIGTHALIEERVKFDNLGLVVIDEQHRFGVEQRARMWTKNSRPPHVLVMTATPIPRTLAMTLYGDLDVSVIDELPPGRKPILTRHLYDSQRMKLFGFLRSEIARGRQVYVVYPLIKESEKMDYKDLYDGFETMSREFPLPQYRLSVVHGKLPAEEKEEGMRAFREGTTQIMVATSVIEVGVDVPNATVMVIESAERFGLSQLHQLRGRVGRGGEQSYCILMSGDRLSREARARLDAMVETNDGFRLSELDLKLRGAGDIGGTQQSGTAFELKIASLAKDAAVVEYARRAAEEILAADPSLTLPENALLARLKERYVNRGETDFGMIS